MREADGFSHPPFLFAFLFGGMMRAPTMAIYIGLTQKASLACGRYIIFLSSLLSPGGAKED
jgi:hypothetical protein